MATKYYNPILSSFLLLLLALTLTIVTAQDDHDHDHDIIPPPPPMAEDNHDHDHDIVPPPPMAEDDHDHDHDTVPPPPPMTEDDHDHDTVPPPPPPPPAQDDHDHDHGPTPPPPPPAAPVTIVNIYDTNAKPVVSGEKYHILPVVQRRGGGIGTTPKNSYERCPLNVVQETDTKALGIPVKFSPKSGAVNITFSTDMNIAFTSNLGCKQSPIWTLKPGNRYNETQYIILGGTTGNSGPNTVKSWFKIERFFPRFHFDYKLVYCPSAEGLPGFKEAICGDLGVYVQEDGTWLLGVGAPPLRIKFKKA